MDPRTERMLEERRAAREAAEALGPGQRLRSWLSAYGRLTVGTVAIVVFGSLVGHYLLVTLPARERDRVLAEQREAGRQQAIQDVAEGEGLDACFATAQSEYAANWDAACRQLKRPESCALPSDQAQSHEATLRQAREDCIRRHASR